MCKASSPKVPTVPTTKAPAEQAAEDAKAASAAKEKEQNQSRANTRGGTLKTGPNGIQTEANTKKKTLLGE